MLKFQNYIWTKQFVKKMCVIGKWWFHVQVFSSKETHKQKEHEIQSQQEGNLLQSIVRTWDDAGKVTSM